MKICDLFETSLLKINFTNLFEAPKVGREYQHIEDLLIVDGAKGGIEAVNELKNIVSNPGNMNMKWDGGAAVYWGRNKNGVFVFAPKNQWDKGQQLSKEELATEIEGTGRIKQGQSQEEFVKIRKEMSNNYNRLWDIFERATPKDFRGYLNGDLMFTEKQIPNSKGYYEFTPNKVTYRVAPNGLYNKIGTAQAFVAVHGKLNEFGAEASGNLMPVPESEIQKFNKTSDLIVLPTQHPNVKLNSIDQKAESLLALIKNNAVAIDSIANFKADKMSGFKKILYDYVVKLAKNNDNLDFIKWLKDSKLSNNQKDLIEKLIDTNTREWKIFWNAFNGIKKLKHDILNNLHNVHGKEMSNNLGIAAITNNKMGGEGFVNQSNNGGMIKLVNPNFRSAPDNPRFKSEINESYKDLDLLENDIKLFKKMLDRNLPGGTFKSLVLLGMDYTELPDLSKLLNSNKILIIRSILEDIKNLGKYSTHSVIFALKALRMMNVSWPELDSIEKSVNAENKQINY